MTEQKIEQFWRDATAEDIAKVTRGEKVEARFRDRDSDEWSSADALGGYDSTIEVNKWIDHTGCAWRFCQVYDPPEILKNKPDPGEGWRLLEKFPPEELQEGDEAWGNYQDNEWGKSDYAERGRRTQSEKLWYRRRIEPNNPEELDGSTCASNIPTGWTSLSVDEPRLASDAYWSLAANDWVIIGDARLEHANRDKWPAIKRLGSFALVTGFNYILPSGNVIRITEKGFEVL